MALHISQRLLMRRYCAFLLDVVIVGISCVLLERSDLSSVLKQFGLLLEPVFRSRLLQHVPPPPVLVDGFALALVYGIVMEATRWKATFGEKIFSLRVVVRSSPVVSLAKIALRNVLKLAACFAIFLLAVYSYAWATLALRSLIGPTLADSLLSVHWIKHAALMLALGLAYLALRFGPASQVIHDRLAGTRLDLNQAIVPI